MKKKTLETLNWLALIVGLIAMGVLVFGIIRLLLK